MLLEYWPDAGTAVVPAATLFLNSVTKEYGATQPLTVTVVSGTVTLTSLELVRIRVSASALGR